MYVETESLSNEFDDQPNWSKKSASAISQDAKIDQLVRITQIIFSNDVPKKNDPLKRKTNLKEIKLFLEKQSNHSASTCGPVVSNYLKNFVKFFETAEGHDARLQKFRAEVEIVTLIVLKFPSYIPIQRSVLMKIILRELSFICSLGSFEYRRFLIDLFVKISIAGKWSFQNSQTFKTHYESLLTSSLNSIYFLAYKYEFYKKSGYPETLDESYSNEELSLIATKDELLELSKENPSKFSTSLMEILNSLIAEKILYNSSFPIKQAINFSAAVLQDITFESSIEGDSKTPSFSTSLQFEVVNFVKLICLRFGSAGIVFMRPLVGIVSDYLIRVAAFLMLRLGEKALTDEFVKSFCGMVSLAECIIRNVTKYAFEQTDLSQILVSLSFSLQRFSNQELPIKNNNAEELINSLSLSGGSKKSRKRKREQMAKLASTNGKETKENSETKGKVYCTMLASTINFCACLFANCSHLFTPEVLHKSMLCFVSISLTSFSGTQTEFSRATVKYPNMNYFKNDDVLLALLSCLEALIIRPNPKCSPPLSILSEILKMAANDERPQVAEKAQQIQILLEMIVKPNMIQVFPSIALEYEPKIEVESQSIQTENQVTLVNVSSQTSEAKVVAQNDVESYVVMRAKKTRSRFVQTDEKFAIDKIGGVGEKKLTSETQSDVNLDCEDDEDNFFDICEQFVPEIV